MQKKLINSQLTNLLTYQMYLRQMTTLAENVFTFKNMPEFIDISYVNKILLRKGSIAFFYDDVLDTLLALPFYSTSGLDVYGRPSKNITVQGQNGYVKTLKTDEYIIMYDNLGKYPIFIDILQYAERRALYTRTIDINIWQQKTPRIIKASTENEKSIRDTMNDIDSFEEKIFTYNNILEDLDMILAPAPFVSDKIQIQKMNDYAEFLALIGISNIQYQKRERNISDEINYSQGGTIASRYNRFEPRKKAIEQINKKWGLNIEVEFYDGLPTTMKEAIEFIEGGENNVLDNGNVSDVNTLSSKE